ncbi:MAG: helix-hairpin-helix domain-containing protein [Planctomycetota bacterium]
MRSDPEPNSGSLTPYLLRRADQVGVAGLVVLGLVSMGGWWIAHGGCRGRLVEIDRAEPQTAEFQVDLNEAGWPELVQLPGIGETLARRIVDSRSQQGPFLDHEDLKRVRGIGPKTLEKVTPYLRPMPERGAIVREAGDRDDQS